MLLHGASAITMAAPARTPDLSLWDLPKSPPARETLFSQDISQSQEVENCLSEPELEQQVQSSLADFIWKRECGDFDVRELLGWAEEAEEPVSEPVQYDVNPQETEELKEIVAMTPVTVEKRRAKRRRVGPVKPYLNEGFNYCPEGLNGIETEGSTPRKRYKPADSTPEASPLATETSTITRNAAVTYTKYEDTEVSYSCVASNSSFTSHHFLIPPYQTLRYDLSIAEVLDGYVLDCDPKRLLTLRTITDSLVLRKHQPFQTRTSIQIKNGSGKSAQVLLFRSASS